MTNYIGLINAMLRKREQDIEYQLSQEKMQMQGMQQLGSGIGNMFASFGEGMQTGRQDSIANTLMNQQMPPSAAAVDPAMQQMFTGEAGTPATGGMSEFKMQLAMEGMRDRQLRTQASQQRINDLKQRQSAADIARYEAKESKSMKDAFNNSMSYHAKMSDITSKLAKAETPEQYGQLSGIANSVYQSAKAAGLDVQPIDIPPYLSPDDKAALAEQQAAVTAAQTGLTEAQSTPETMTLHPIWGSAEPDPRRASAIQIAQEKFEKEQQALRTMPGGAPKANTPAVTATAQAGTAGAAPENTRITNAEGKTMIKRGGKWVEE